MAGVQIWCYLSFVFVYLSLRSGRVAGLGFLPALANFHRATSAASSAAISGASPTPLLYFTHVRLHRMHMRRGGVDVHVRKRPDM